MRQHRIAATPHCPSLVVLRDDAVTADVRLTFEDGVITAHRAVLAACSPVLLEAFFGVTAVQPVEQLSLPGKRKQDFNDLLNYCYGAPLFAITQSNSLTLLQLSEEYGIMGLKSEVEQYLIASFDSGESSASEVVHWAKIYSCPALLEHVEQEVRRLVRGHLNAGNVKRARALAHEQSLMSVLDMMAQFDAGQLSTGSEDSLTLKSLLLQRPALPKAARVEVETPLKADLDPPCWRRPYEEQFGW